MIVLTASEDKNEFVQAMKLGCSGIVLKQTAPDLIVKSIRKVNAGEIWLDSHTTAAVMRPLAKGIIWGVLAATDKLKETVAETREQVNDLVAEVRAEYADGTNSTSTRSTKGRSLSA